MMESPQSLENNNQMRILTDDEVNTALRDIGVPERYLAATKANIDTKTWALTEDFRHFRKEGLFIYGPAGTGKTYLAVALLRARIEIVKVMDTKDTPMALDFTGIKFISCPELLLEIRKAFNSDDITEEQVIEKYTDRTKILVLDDLGAEKSTEWVIQTLYLIIDRRYRNMQRTIITSNLNLGEIAVKLHDRISSRISEMCKVIELKGKDRRVK